MSRRPEQPIVYLITSGRSTPENFHSEKSNILRLITAAADARVDLVQIREKNISAGLLFELVEQAVGITHGSRTGIMVNDRADIAVAAGANGVHLASRSLPVKLIRERFGSKLTVGVSVHSTDEAVKAAREGADLVVFGPVFATPGKGDPQGIERLAAACDATTECAVLALGGVNEHNFGSALDAGAAGIAAIRMYEDAERLHEIVGEIKSYGK